jgi:hypothetical protein
VWADECPTERVAGIEERVKSGRGKVVGSPQHQQLTEYLVAAEAWRRP